MWYGVSSILARFLNYLLTPYLTNPQILSLVQYGEMSVVYAAIPFMSALFTYGFEITYFRYSNKDENENVIFDTSSLSIIITTLLFTSVLVMFNEPIAAVLTVKNHPEFVTWAAIIIALDTLAVLPLAKLRHVNRPKKYALIRVAGIVINIVSVVFFYTFLPEIATNNPDSIFATWYDPALGAGYVLIANIISSGLMLLLLSSEVLSIRFQGSLKLWKEMILYSLPLMLAGFAGVINETFDRIILGWLIPEDAPRSAKEQISIYSGCYKLSLLINIFIQAFRLAAEPFFFAEAKNKNAPETYARVMKYIVIAMSCMFLVVMLYIDFWKHFLQNQEMWEGLKIVPILLIANMSLGVYYNLSFWYKLSNKTHAAIIIAFTGAGLTLLVNFLLIPTLGYMASAWATLACYGSMMLISYFWGRKVYPVPYEIGKLGRFVALMMLLFFIHKGISTQVESVWLRFATGTVLILGYVAYIVRVEKEDMKGLPVIGKFIR